MSKKDKTQKVTLKSIFRFIIFLFLAWLIISFLSKQNQNKQLVDDPTLSFDEISQSFGGDVLGDMYSKLPSDSRSQIENFNQTEAGKIFSNSFGYIKEQLNDFPQKQIREIKKAIIKNVSDEMIKNIDEN
jgi:hypothetical protein